MEDIYNIILSVLATVLTGLASWGVSVLVAWINSKIKNEKVRAAIESARDIIVAAVAETSQTFVDNLKKTGDFSEALQAEAYEKTFSRVKSQLTAEAYELIKATVNDVDAWIASEIEKAVADRKKGG